MEQNVKFLPKHKTLVPQGHVQVYIQNPKEKTGRFIYEND